MFLLSSLMQGDVHLEVKFLKSVRINSASRSVDHVSISGAETNILLLRIFEIYMRVEKSKYCYISDTI
jgi:hypothetical protein